MRRLTILTLVTLSLLIHAPTAAGSTIHLSVAASMKEAMTQICREYQLKNPHIRFLPNYGSSGSLAKQIAQGAPADIYISANPKWMNYLQEAEKVFISGKNVNIFSIADLLKIKRLAIGSPASVPAGEYAKQALTAAGIYDKLTGEGRLVMAKDVRQALIYADRGEVEGAFVYRTDAILAKNAEIIFTVQPGMHKQIIYPAGLTEKGLANHGAVLFFQYLTSETTGAILEQYGFRIE